MCAFPLTATKTLSFRSQQMHQPVIPRLPQIHVPAVDIYVYYILPTVQAPDMPRRQSTRLHSKVTPSCQFGRNSATRAIPSLIYIFLRIPPSLCSPPQAFYFPPDLHTMPNMPSIISESDALRTKLTALSKRLTGDDADTLSQLLDKWESLNDSTTATANSDPVQSAPVVKYATVKITFLRQFMQDALIAAGVPHNEASVAAEVLEWADVHGVSTHGIGRLKPIYINRINDNILKPTAPFDIVSETETTAVVDGHCGLGLFIGPKCMDMCIEKAKKQGLAMVVVRNSTHYGAAGYYVDKAQQRGCIGITGTNARPSIAPTFGVQPMLGTNPMTFGMPSDDDFPFILDCATSVNQRGKIEKYAREGKPTPPGQVVDRDGNVRTDTVQILKDLQTGYCSLAPLGGVGAEMGGYKGKLWLPISVSVP